MHTITAAYDNTEQLINVDDAGLAVEVSAGAVGCMGFLAGAIAAHMGAVVTGYCQRHQLDASGLSVELAYSEENGQLEKMAAVVTLPNADCHKRLTALQEIAAQCTLATVPVTVSIHDRAMLRSTALAFEVEKSLIVDDQPRDLANL